MSKNNPWNFHHSLTELENVHFGLKKDVNKTRLWEAYRWLEWEYGNFDNVKMAYGNEQVAKRNRHYAGVEKENDKLKSLLATEVTKAEKTKGTSFVVTGVVGIVAIVAGIVIGMFAV